MTKETNMTDTEIINLNEAPASVTYSITSKGGYNALFTIRATSGKELLITMDDIEKVLIAKEYKPQAPKFGQKKEIEYVKDLSGNPMLCPTCKVGHIKIINSAKGTFYGCDTSKFDPVTKTYTGCKFFSNTDPSKIVVKPEADPIDGWDGVEANKDE
jgi:hypothetical protein